MVQTSLNLGILYTERDQVCAGLLVRSSVESQKEMVAERIEGLLRQLGGQAFRGRGCCPVFLRKALVMYRIQYSVYSFDRDMGLW